MRIFVARKITFPLEKYKVNGAKFKENCVYGGVDWGLHLGEDVNVSAGTDVRAIGNGTVIYSALHAGTKEKSNWGNIIIIAHKKPVSKEIFYSLYGHLENRLVKTGDKVKLGEIISQIAKSNTPENGMWPEAHLHFGVYLGEWKGEVLPGYYNRNSKNRTKLKDWLSPTEFIENYK